MTEQGLVLTTGCFDIIHAGHVRFLDACRNMGSALIVCLDSDQRVELLKGRGHPIFPFAERKAVLMALRCVDIVYAVDSRSRLTRYLDTLRPNVYVKGPDSTPETIIGADIVRCHGGIVRAIAEPLVDVSMPAIVERIRSAA